MKKRNQIKRLAAAAMVGGLVTGASLKAGAEPIVILNPSFENPITNPLPGGTNYPKPDDWTNSDPAAFRGYSGALRASDIYATAPDGEQYFYTNATDPDDPDGFVESQVTTYDAVLGDTFTLTVALGTSNLSLVGTIALTIDGQIVAENTADSTGTPTPLTGGNPNSPGFYPGTFADATATYQLTAADALANPSLVGGAVGVELISADGGSFEFDNVRLNVTPVAAPEPSTWALMLAGVLSLAGLQRFKRKA